MRFASRHRTPDARRDHPPRRSRASGTLAATFLALITVTAAVLFAVHHDHRPPSPALPAPTPPPSSSPSASAAPGEIPGFGVPQADPFGRRIDIPGDPGGQVRSQQLALQKQPSAPDWLTAAPAGLCHIAQETTTCEPGGWQKVHGAVVPFSTSDGPTRLEHGVAAGYGHTPQGAALAAAYTAYEVAARPGDRRLLATRLLLTATDQQQFESGIAAGTLPVQQDPQHTQWMLAWDAFRLADYSPDFAVVRLAARAPDTDNGPTWSTVTVPMVWHNNDWLVRGTGSELPVETIRDLAGWTPW